MKVLLVVVFIFIFVLAGVAVRAVNHPNECETRTSADQKADQQQEKETIWCPASWEPVTAFTCILAISTAGLWIFTALLWITTQRAVGDGEKAIAASVKAANAASRHICKPLPNGAVRMINREEGNIPASELVLVQDPLSEDHTD